MRRIVAGVVRPSSQVWAPGFQVETRRPYPGPVNRRVEQQVRVAYGACDSISEAGARLANHRWGNYGDAAPAWFPSFKAYAPPGWISTVGGRPRAIAAYRRDLAQSLPVEWPSVPVIAPGISLATGPAQAFGPTGKPYGSYGNLSYGLTREEQMALQQTYLPGGLPGGLPATTTVSQPSRPSFRSGSWEVGGYTAPIMTYNTDGVSSDTTTGIETVADGAWAPMWQQGAQTEALYADMTPPGAASSSPMPWILAGLAALAAAGGAYAYGKRR
jgi:hypothetical protein